ncbi:SDR family oxidoreductase [Membranicola marinus]|uniref:SDR family oxidoreductase n=1 Tax=Membranihabitans marinus TaxID=1227546 RepID=A0A953HQL7_9BACT|nr:SDR family oxidoreductase [Membranihabitans marinus]MBY5956511.1 SDR family oxidoreductase [Membranihabitans marinus]
MKSIYSLANQTIWVIGGAGYLGRHIVATLLEQNYHVVCADINGRAAEFAENLEHPETLYPVELDARNEKAIDRFIEEQIADTGVPDGLVILTYGAAGKKLEEMTGADFDQASQLGVTSTFLLARSVGLHMVEQGRGQIVLFSSMYGMVSPDPNMYLPPMKANPIEYGVGKAGIIQMTKYLAVLWGRTGVRVNCISPGPFPSEQVQAETPEFIDRLSNKVPLGRIGAPKEIAGPVLFLLSDASSFVTGHNLVVDGGWTAW